MTTPADFGHDDAALPGLPALPGLDQGDRHQGPNEEAARRTLAALAGLSMIGEHHAVMAQALLTAAQQLDRAAATGRAKDYGVANLIRELRDTYLVLMPPESEGGERSAWDRFLDDVANSGGGAPAVRDTP